MQIFGKKFFIVLITILTQSSKIINCGDLSARIRACLAQEVGPDAAARLMPRHEVRVEGTADEMYQTWQAIKATLCEAQKEEDRAAAFNPEMAAKLQAMSDADLQKYFEESKEFAQYGIEGDERIFIKKTEKRDNIIQYPVKHQGDTAVCGYYALENGIRLTDGIIAHNDASALLKNPIDIRNQQEFITAYRLEKEHDASSDWLQSDEIEYLYEPTSLSIQPRYRAIAENYMRAIGQSPIYMLDRQACQAGYALRFMVVDTADDLFDVFDKKSTAESVRHFFKTKDRAIQIFIIGTGARIVQGEEITLTRGHWFTVVAAKNEHGINYYVTDSLNVRDFNKEGVAGIKFIIEGE